MIKRQQGLSLFMHMGIQGNMSAGADGNCLQFLVGFGRDVQDEVLDLAVQYPAQIVQRLSRYIFVVFQAVKRAV